MFIKVKPIQFLLVLFLISSLFHTAVAKKVALLIGNDAYTNLNSLANPVNDVATFSKVLKLLDFEVTVKTNITSKTDFQETVANFRDTIDPRDTVLFYFSGHGVQIDSQNYLVPTEASERSEAILKDGSVNVNYILDELNDVSDTTNILILDACRNAPEFTKALRSTSSRSGLAILEATGTIISYSAGRGEYALDSHPNIQSDNSPYMHYLKQFITDPDLDLIDVFKEVQIAVNQNTNGIQRPEYSDGIVGRVYLGRQDNGGTVPVVQESLKLYVDSEPRGAAVRIDGTVVGNTPSTFELSDGSHRVTVSLDGYQSYSEDVLIRRDIGAVSIQQILARLTAIVVPNSDIVKPPSTDIPIAPIQGALATGRLDIVSEPSGAFISINGDLRGFTPLTNIDLKTGEYEIQLELDGYDIKSKNVTIDAGQLTSLNVAMPIIGTNPIANNSDWIPQTRNVGNDRTVAVIVPAGSIRVASNAEEIQYARELCEEADTGNLDKCPTAFQEEEVTEDVIYSISRPFLLDKFEVTRAAYDKCVDEKVCPAKSKDQFSKSARQPIHYVNLNEAAQYCEWHGGRLPTELEWEYAARGPDRLIWPWGDTIQGNEANHCDSNCANSSWVKQFPWKNVNNDDEFEVTAPVGSYPQGASWVGALDLSGNVWEWVADAYEPHPYQLEDKSSVRDHAYVDRELENPIIRGGSFNNRSSDLRAAARGLVPPDMSARWLGFRCAYELE